MTSINTQLYAAVAVQSLHPTRAGSSETLQSEKDEPIKIGKDKAVFSPEAYELAAAEELAVSSDGPKGDSELTQEEKQEVAKLRARDAEVKAHEQAHLSALGGKGGAASYQYTTGPDGGRYATSGEVPVSIGESAQGPEATIRDAQQVARAAVAPAQPSSADQAARAKAQQVEAKARQELREKQKDGENGERGEEELEGTDISAADSKATGLIDSATIIGKAETTQGNNPLFDQAHNHVPGETCAICAQGG